MNRQIHGIYSQKRNGGNLVLYPAFFNQDGEVVSRDELAPMLEPRQPGRKTALYVNIPFCKSICSFCCFTRMVKPPQVIRSYVDALHKEIDLYAKTQYFSSAEIDAIYFGGGTPSILDAGDLENLIRKIKESLPISRDAEITVEGSTSTFSREKLEAARRAGANRLSFGVQTFNDADRQILNLPDTAAEASATIRTAQEAGYDNIDIDLIYHLPGQTRENFCSQLHSPIELGVESISFFTLGVYPQSPLARQLKEGKIPPLASEDTNLDMYLSALDILSQAGYLQRHISRFSLPGKDHVYSILRQTHNDCVSMGLVSNGSIGPYIYKNTTDLDTYIRMCEQDRFPINNLYKMTRDDEMRRFFIRGLGLLEVDLTLFRDLFGVNAREVLGDIIGSLEGKGLLECDEESARLTRAGRAWGHNVCGEFCSAGHRQEYERKRGVYYPVRN